MNPVGGIVTLYGDNNDRAWWPLMGPSPHFAARISVACGARRIFSEQRLPNRINEYAPLKGGTLRQDLKAGLKAVNEPSTSFRANGALYHRAGPHGRHEGHVVEYGFVAKSHTSDPLNAAVANLRQYAHPVFPRAPLRFASDRRASLFSFIRDPLQTRVPYFPPTLTDLSRHRRAKRAPSRVHGGVIWMKTTGFRQQFTTAADACALAQGIVDTVREPVLVLDKELRVIAASRSFYSAFRVTPEDTQGRLLYELGDGQSDIPKLRVLLEKIIPEHGVMEDYEVEHKFPELGQRAICLNARQVFYEGNAGTTFCWAWRTSPLHAAWSAKG